MSSEVLVRLQGLAFPRICPACGNAASGPIRIRKAFTWSDEDEIHERLIEFDVWFCARCLKEHESSERKPTALDFLRRLFSAPGTALGALVVGGVGLAFLQEALMKMSLLVLSMAGFALGMSWWLFRQSWNERPGQHLPPPTPVTGKVDFGDIESQEFEAPWLRFRFARQDYADAFRGLNAERIWDPGGGEAMAARQQRAWQEKRRQWMFWAFAAMALCFAILAWWMDWDS